VSGTQGGSIYAVGCAATSNTIKDYFAEQNSILYAFAYYEKTVTITVVSAISGLVVGDSVTAENSATGVVTVLANSGTILEIKYSGTDFSETGGSNGLDKGTSYSVPGDTTITDEDTVTVATSTFSPAIDTEGNFGAYIVD